MTDRRETCIAIVNLPPRAMMGIDSCGMLISAVHHEEGQEKLHLLQVDPQIPAGAKLYYDLINDKQTPSGSVLFVNCCRVTYNTRQLKKTI